MIGAGPSVRAVVFDLWLTLIPFPGEARRSAFRLLAAALGVSVEELRPHWDATRSERETGDLARYLSRLGPRLGYTWSPAMIEAAMAARRSAHGACFAEPFSDGRAAIAGLRDRGILVGLVSNCTSDVRLAMVEHEMAGWFDAVILSAEVGIMKPAPEIFELAARRLDVEPAACLFVGDGGDDELDGAAAAGMTPLRYDPTGSRVRSVGASVGGPSAIVISSHLDLLPLVDR